MHTPDRGYGMGAAMAEEIDLLIDTVADCAAGRTALGWNVRHRVPASRQKRAPIGDRAERWKLIRFIPRNGRGETARQASNSFAHGCA
jgi:hypothetical protein